MKILFYSAILALAAVICSCSNNDDDNKDSSKDSNAKESGYVGDFSGKEASVLFAVEAPSAGSYSITIKGRAKGSSAGTGVLTANGSNTDITFAGSDCRPRAAWRQALRLTLHRRRWRGRCG